MAFGPVNTPGTTKEQDDMNMELRARVEQMEKSLTGMEKISGAADPTPQTAAQVGQIYINVTTGEQWKCVSAEDGATVWEKLAGSGTALSAGDVGAKESGWKPFHAGASAPDDKTQMWIDTDPNNGGLKYWNGAAWVHAPVAYT